jgi:hypothetical protein
VSVLVNIIGGSSTAVAAITVSGDSVDISTGAGVPLGREPAPSEMS